MASPAFVSVGTGKQEGDPGTTSLTSTIGIHSNGDLLVLVITISNNSSPAQGIDTPSGWTKRIDIEAGTFSAVRLTVFTKIGNGVESSVSWTNTNTVNFESAVLAYSGAQDAIDASGTTVTDSTADATSPSITTIVADTLIIYGWVMDFISATEADHDSDAGFNGTSRHYAEGLSGSFINGMCFAVSDEGQAGIGASNTCIWSMNGNTDAACTFTISIPPSAGGAGILRSLLHREQMKHMLNR